MCRVNLLVPTCLVRGQLQPGEPLSSSGSIMGTPHLRECLALRLRRNPHGPVETETETETEIEIEIGERGETSSRLGLEVEGLHGNEALVGATW